MAQGFVGRISMVADVYLMNSQKEFVQTLTDTICHRGAMDLLISDCKCTYDLLWWLQDGPRLRRANVNAKSINLVNKIC